MFDEETRPNPMTPETNSGNTTEGQQHAEPYMTLEHNLEKRIDKLGPEMRTVAQNLIESRDINNGEIKSEVWADAMLKVYYLNNADVDDNVFARDVILKYCADRRWRLGQDQHLSDAKKAKEFRIIEKYEAKAEEFNEKVTPSPDALRPPDQRMPTLQPDTLVPSPARVDVGGQNRPADAEKNQQAIGNWLFLGTGLDFESLPSEIQNELGRYVKIVSGTPSERAIIDRLFNYVWDLSSDQRLSEEQRNEMMSVLDVVAQRQEEIQQDGTRGNLVNEKVILSPERQFQKFLEDEEWGKSKYTKLDREGEGLGMPTYTEGLSEHELDRLDARRELINAVNYKRTMEAPSLETLSNNAALEQINKAETLLLLDIPGVWEAMVLYVRLYEGDYQFTGKGDKPFSLRTAKDNDQLDVIRQYVRGSIRDHVVAGYMREPEQRLVGLNGLDREQAIETYMRTAEQVAFNLHYIANYFEAHDDVWEPYDAIPGAKRLVRKAENMNNTVHPAIRIAMDPMFGTIDSTSKREAKKAYVGEFGRWAYEQTSIEWGNLETNYPGINRDYDEVIVLPESEEYRFKYWTIEQIGTRTDSRGNTHPRLRLYAYPAYPLEFLGSAWDEVTIGKYPRGHTKAGEGIPIIEYIRAGTRPPFEQIPDAEGLWGQYDFQMTKASALREYLLGKKPIKWGAGGGGGHLEWVQDVENMLSRFNAGDDVGLKRRILYSSVGLKSGALPQIRYDKTVIRKLLGSRRLKYLTDNQLFYPWDRENIIFRFGVR